MLNSPRITEKSVKLSHEGKYTFVVDVKDDKTSIKKWVEKMFDVNVTKVQTVHMTGKTYRSGKRYIIRQKPDWKKAIVTVKSGQKIDLFENK